LTISVAKILISVVSVIFFSDSSNELTI